MQNIFNSIIQFAQDKSPDLIWIIIFYFLAKILLKLLARKIIKISEVVNARRDANKKKRSETITKIIFDNGSIIIDVAVLLWIMGIFGLDLRPVLAGLGIVGLAVGFGAQSLIKDFVSGLFILVENQYNIGDKVQIGGAVGKVVKITLRSTVLEDDENKVYYVANGSITSVVNFSQK